MFEHLQETGIAAVNLEMCEFPQTKLEFVGFYISPEGLKSSESRVEAIKNVPLPEKTKALQGFLGMVY